MNKEDKKLQKHLVDEMMKVSKTNPDVMIYMETLMKKYEELEQENINIKQQLLENKISLKDVEYQEKMKLKKEVDRLNNIIKKLIYECWGSDMSYGEFEEVWQIAFDEKYEPDKIKKIEEELKEDNKQFDK